MDFINVSKILIFYLIITISVFVAHYFSTPFEKKVMEGNKWYWGILFGWYMIFAIIFGEMGKKLLF